METSTGEVMQCKLCGSYDIAANESLCSTCAIFSEEHIPVICITCRDDSIFGSISWIKKLDIDAEVQKAFAAMQEKEIIAFVRFDCPDCRQTTT